MIVDNCNIEYEIFADLDDKIKENKKYIKQVGTTLIVDKNKNILEKNLNVDFLYTSTVMKKNKKIGKCNAI